jgi:hypothetical protein
MGATWEELRSGLLAVTPIEASQYQSTKLWELQFAVCSLPHTVRRANVRLTWSVVTTSKPSLIMDDKLKDPAKMAAEIIPENVKVAASPVGTKDKDTARGQDPKLDQMLLIKQLVGEALSANADLPRLLEINRVVGQLVTAQLDARSNTPAVSAESATSMRQTLRQMALDSYREEYKELSDVWKALETKAQGTVTIAGIFIAAAFTFAKDLATTRLDFYGNLFLGAAIIFLIPTIILSVLVLWRRTVKSIPGGEAVEQWADDIGETLDEDLPEMTRRFIDQQSSVWKTTVSSAKEAITQKENLLHAAQILLLLAIGAAAVVTLKLINV